MITEQLQIELDGIGFTAEEIARLSDGYGAPVLQEAWFRYEMREMAEEIADPQKYFLGICNGLRTDGFAGTPTAAPSGGHVGRAPVSEAEQNRRAWQSKLIEVVDGELAKKKDDLLIPARQAILRSITVTAVAHDEVVVEAPEKYHVSIYNHFGPLCLGRTLHLIDPDTGTAQAYETESVRVAPFLSREEIRRRAGLQPV